MKKFTKFMSAAVLAAASLSLSGCQDEDFGYNAKAISYIKNFKQIYGEVDQTQDWNLAERASVTVTTANPSQIKIYANYGGTYRIVGDYANISGTRTLGFDVVEGTKDILVSAGYASATTTVGGSVSFASTTTRTIPTTAISEKYDHYFEIPQSIYSKWYDFVPEGKLNLGKVSQNFTYVSQGDFILYPIYWDTSNSNVIGIYYTDETGYHETAIYTIKTQGDEIQTASYIWQEITDADDPRNSKDYDAAANGWTVVSPSKGYPETDKDFIAAVWVDYNDGHGLQKTTNAKIPTYNWTNSAETGNYPFYVECNADGSLKSGPAAIRSKGIKISLPVGQSFGMYLTDGGGTTYYSENQYNSDCGIDYTMTETGGKIICTKTGTNTSIKATHACTFKSNDYLYFGFEDWDNGTTGDKNSDFDLNDNMFMMAGDLPTVVEETSESWILSAEDLGNTFDIDYNDVVVEVSHVSGRKSAYVTPLAAGGTLASYVYFGTTCLGEIHGLFGVPATTSGDYTPINVDATTPSYGKAQQIEITVDEEFSMSSYLVGNTNQAVGSMGGFTVKVVPEGTMASESAAAASTQKVQNAIGKGSENVPYVICTPQKWEIENGDGTITKGNYRWPMETTPMVPTAGFSDGPAYNTTGHSFGEWVADKDNATDWFKYPDLNCTVAISTPITVSSDPDIDPTPGPTPSANDYSALGTSVTVDTETIQYASLIATSNLPTTGSVTFTYVFSMEGQTFVNIQNPYIKGKFWNDSNQYTQYWDDVTLGNVTVSDIITGNPNYLTISITVEASAYANCTYINFGAGYCNGSLIGAYYKEL